MSEQIPFEFRRLLAESLCEKPGSYIMEQLFSVFPRTEDLIDATEQELAASIKGVGHTKARQIVAALSLARSLTPPSLPTDKISSPADVYRLVEPDLRFAKREHLITLFLNTKNMVIAKELIAIGSLNACIVHPREVFRQAIKRASASIIVVHNHPSGNPEPSPEDIEITKRLMSAGTIIGIDVLDHIIIGDQRYISLTARGLMSLSH
ncbi:hypothetical protein D3C74_172470 [compost metagenome]